MPSNFPATLDALTNPSPTTPTTDATTPHASQHANINDIIEAIEAKLGIGTGGPPASASVLRRTGTGVSGWGQVQAGDIVPESILGATAGPGVGRIGLQTVYGGQAGANANITPNTLVGGDLVADTITTRELADGSVQTANIANLNIGTQHIADAQITTAKIAAGATATTQTSAGSTADPSTGATSAPAAPGIAQMLLSVTVEVNDWVIIIFDTIFSHSSAGQVSIFDLYWNFANIQRRQMNCPVANQQQNVTMVFPFLATSAGTFQLDARFWVTAGTVTCFATQRALTAIRIRR